MREETREFLQTTTMVRYLFRLSLITFFSLFIGWALLFVLIETVPSVQDILPLRQIPYYSLKREYVADPGLIFKKSRVNYSESWSYVGDLAGLADGLQIEVSDFDYSSTYNDDGFRLGFAGPPYEIAVIGDSFVEFGEDEEKTFTSILGRKMGKSVLNLGRAWYGPYQYLELLKRYALSKKPKYVLVCFFSGNDLHDMRNFESWRTEGRYYFYRNSDELNIFSRFAVATNDVMAVMGKKIASMWTRSDTTSVGIMNIGDNKVPMGFFYWGNEVTRKDLDTLKTIFSEFKTIAYANGIVPVLIYIPTKTQVYSDLYSEESAIGFKRRIKSISGNPSLDALVAISDELDIKLVNLLPAFKDSASQGNLLYYPFDTHWNLKAREIAAALIASQIESIPIPSPETRSTAE